MRVTTPRPLAPGQVPRWARPKLTRGQVLDLQLLHVALLDTLASPDAGPTALWEFVATVLTWSHTAELLGRATELMAPQLELATEMVLHFRSTGEVRISGLWYQLARAGTMVMDALAEYTDAHTAEQAANWSEMQLATLRAVTDQLDIAGRA